METNLPLTVRGRLLDLSRPRVMGILNATPDSFFAGSRAVGAEAVVRRARQLVDEGADILDIGACSTRPGSEPVDEQEEWQRLEPALQAVRSALPDVPLSIDTFRASVAQRSVSQFGADVINDISGGELDPLMFPTVAELGVPYVLMHGGAQPSCLPPDLTDAPAVLAAVARYLAGRLQQLYALGVADVILDPGFGFGKTMDQNYALFAHLADLRKAFPATPLLVGISRKRMVWQLLGSTPDQALNGTTVLNTLALHSGAHLLRVHDVRQAVEAVGIVRKVCPNAESQI